MSKLMFTFFLLEERCSFSFWVADFSFNRFAEEFEITVIHHLTTRVRSVKYILRKVIFVLCEHHRVHSHKPKWYSLLCTQARWYAIIINGLPHWLKHCYAAHDCIDREWGPLGKADYTDLMKHFFNFMLSFFSLSFLTS